MELTNQQQVDSQSYRGLGRLYLRLQSILMRFPVVGKFLRTVFPFAVVALLWHAVASAGIYSAVLFPDPLTVLKAGWESLFVSGELLSHVKESMLNLGLGFVVGAGIAIPLGLAMGLVRPVANFFEPVITLFQAIPGLAWIPLAILWFGADKSAVVFIIFTSVFFPVLYSMLAGVRSTEPALIDAARTVGSDTFKVIFHVILPSSLPNLITGIRLAFGYGFRSLVAGEMVVATAGLGYMIFDARRYMRSDLVMVGMIVMGLIWLIIDRTALKAWETRTIERWGMVRD